MSTDAKSPFDATSSVNRDPLEMLAEEFIERRRRGELPPLSEFISRRPDLESEIRELFPALEFIEKLKPTNFEGSSNGSAPSTAELAQAPHVSMGAAFGLLGDYRLQREIGRGGMGVVYQAYQESLQRTVALKVLAHTGRMKKPEKQRFQVEARSAARLNHPNIVPVYGVGEHDGVPYYVMQLILGHGLDEVLKDLRILRGLDKKPSNQTEPNGADAGAAAEPSPTMAIARSLATNGFLVKEASARSRPRDGCVYRSVFRQFNGGKTCRRRDSRFHIPRVLSPLVICLAGRKPSAATARHTLEA